MPFHVSAYSQSENPSTLTQVNALTPDQVLQVRDNSFIAHKVNKVGMVVGFAAHLTRLQMQAPSLRKVAQLEIQPIVNAAPAGGNGWGFVSYENPDMDLLELEDGEEFGAFATDSNASAEQITVGVRLHDGPVRPVKGRIFSMRVTASTTLTANAWSNCTLTLDQNLPKGNFAVVGARFKSAGALLFRMVFLGQAYRPGGIAEQSDLALDLPLQRFGRLGQWGTFESVNPPTIDVLSTSADTSEEGVLDLMMV